MAKSKKLGPKLQPWIDARQRHRLSHAQVQMARELGMNPKSLGKLANCEQQAWKMPLPDYIHHLYAKRFGRERPEIVRPIEDLARLQKQKRAARKERSRSRDPEATQSSPEIEAVPNVG